MDAQRALNVLAGEPLLHADMIECIRNGQAELLAVTGRSVLLYSRACAAYMMTAPDREGAAKLLELVDSAAWFVAHQASYLPQLIKRFPLRVEMECLQAVYLQRTPPAARGYGLGIRPLGEEYLPLVCAHYARAGEEPYLRERLRAGVMVGAFDGDGRLMGFVGMHREGSIGMLEVLPAFRRRGVARALLAHLTGRILAKGGRPFSQIITENEASLALHRALGFSISGKPLYWLFADTRADG